MTQPLIELQDVSFCYAGGIIALDSFSSIISGGRRTAVLGRNGSGKTTLFSLLNGLLRPQKGTVLFAGEPISYDRAGLLKLRQNVGMVFQDPDCQLFSACIYEDVSFGPLNLGLAEGEVRKRVASALQQMQLEGLENRPTHSLSFGQKKRACIAGVLAMKPQVLVLDEPFAGLDPRMAAEFMSILEELHHGGTTVIIATHDLDLAYSWADDAIILQKGHLLAQGTAMELLVQPQVHVELGAAPLVAEISQALIANGIDTGSDGTLPRNRSQLVQSLLSKNRTNG